MPLARLCGIAQLARVSGCPGPLAELVDATDLKSVVRKDVPVRFRQGPPAADGAHAIRGSSDGGLL